MKFCTNHASIKASWQCPRCKSYLCETCTEPPIEAPGIPKCPHCGMKKASSKGTKGDTDSYGFSLLRAFQYPFIGTNFIALIFIVLFSLGLHVLSSIRFSVFGIIVMLLGGGYIASYFMAIVGSTIVGKDDLPEWPEWRSLISSYFIFMTPVFVSFLPATLYFWLSDDPNQSIRILLLVGGAFYMPMAIGSVSAETSAFGALPNVVFPLIFADIGKYLMTFIVVLVVILGMALSSGVGVFSGPFLGIILYEIISGYLTLVSLRLIGLVYANNSKDF